MCKVISVGQSGARGQSPALACTQPPAQAAMCAAAERGSGKTELQTQPENAGIESFCQVQGEGEPDLSLLLSGIAPNVRGSEK